MSFLLRCLLRFPRKTDVQFIFTPICFVGDSFLLMLFVFTYVYWGSTRFTYQMIFMSFKSNTTGVISEAGITNPSEAPEFTPGFNSGVALSILSFLCRVLYNIVYSYVLVLLAMVSSVLFRFTASAYPFGILILFFKD